MIGSTDSQLLQHYPFNKIRKKNWIWLKKMGIIGKNHWGSLTWLSKIKIKNSRNLISKLAHRKKVTEAACLNFSQTLDLSWGEHE